MRGIVVSGSNDRFILPGALPLQFPSLDHFDARVTRALTVVAHVEKLSAKTQAWMRDCTRVFRAFLATDNAAARRFLGGDVRQQVQVLQQWVGAMNDAGLARSTVNNYWRAVRMLCARIAREDGTINPFAFVRAPHPGFTEPKYLTPDAATAVLQFVQNDARVAPHLRARNAALFGVMLLAGLRRAETIDLDVAHVDFISHVLRVKRGKGRYGGKPRTVPMTPQLEQLCAAYYGSYRRTRATVCPRFFLGTRGRGALSLTTVNRLFRRVSRRTGTHVTPHMLRHTFCTLLSRAGVADRLAREAMGHADFATLQRYQHVYEGEVAAEMTAKLHLDID